MDSQAKLPENEVFLTANGLVEARYIGDQTEAKISSTYERQHKLGEEIKQTGKPTFFLIDVSELGRTTAESRKLAVEHIDKLDVTKLAVFGGSTFNKHLVNLVLSAIGKTNIMKYFSTRAEAETWLLN